MATKMCTKCKEAKSVSEFYKNNRVKDGLDYYCKFCRVGKAMESQRDNKRTKRCSIEGCEGIHYAKSYCRNHYRRWFDNGTTERLNQPLIGNETRSYGNTYNKMKRDYTLYQNYKLRYQDFLNKAVNGCEICSESVLESLQIDHDHDCCPNAYSCGNCVRGVVCRACNTSIGKYETNTIRKDNPKLERIIAYINKYKELHKDAK